MPVVLEIARQTFLLQLRSRIYWLLLVLAAGLGGLFLVLPRRTSRVPGDELFEAVAYGSAFTLVLPFIALYLAVQAVHGDLEDRTNVYLFTRPISRVWILLGKWLAVMALGAIYVVVAMTALYLAIAESGRVWQGGTVPTAWNYGVMMLAGALAVAGYSAMGCLFAAWFRRPLLISVVYIVLQQFASRMPAQAGIHSVTVADPVRRFILESMRDPSRDLREVLSGRFGGPEAGDALLFSDPLAALAKLLVVVMAVAAVIYCRREYDSRPRE